MGKSQTNTSELCDDRPAPKYIFFFSKHLYLTQNIKTLKEKVLSFKKDLTYACILFSMQFSCIK